MNIRIGTATLLMMIQFSPIAFIFVPAVTVSYLRMRRDRSDSVSELTNFMRNIGSSVGTSLVVTVLAWRSQFHLARMADHTSLGDAG
jgi:DHA2 family multidrug resistance protein